MSRFAEILTVYEGSDGEATRGLYDRLDELGPIGNVAVNLFRAQKSSARAKVYRGRRYKGAAYDRKGWALDNLCRSLTEHDHGFQWGWKEDLAQPVYRQVLYVELPTGQVSFHASERGSGPDFAGDWDGIRGASAARICRWIAELLAS